MPLAMPVTEVQPVFFNGARAKQRNEATERGQSEGAKRPSGRRVWEGVSPTVGRLFETSSCMKTSFCCILYGIIRGLGYVKWYKYQSSILPPPFFFLRFILL